MGCPSAKKENWFDGSQGNCGAYYIFNIFQPQEDRFHEYIDVWLFVKNEIKLNKPGIEEQISMTYMCTVFPTVVFYI